MPQIDSRLWIQNLATCRTVNVRTPHAQTGFPPRHTDPPYSQDRLVKRPPIYPPPRLARRSPTRAHHPVCSPRKAQPARLPKSAHEGHVCPACGRGRVRPLEVEQGGSEVSQRLCIQSRVLDVRVSYAFFRYAPPLTLTPSR